MDCPTAHLLKSVRKAQQLRDAMAQLNRTYKDTVEEPIPDDMQALLNKLK